jgi:hypothetical protein
MYSCTFVKTILHFLIIGYVVWRATKTELISFLSHLHQADSMHFTAENHREFNTKLCFLSLGNHIPRYSERKCRVISSTYLTNKNGYLLNYQATLYVNLGKTCNHK